MKQVSTSRNRIAWHSAFLALLVSTLIGCSGKQSTSGQPDDISIPENMQVLGASGDQELFVIRLRSAEYEMQEIVTLFRTNMQDAEWRVKSDSATDEHGGELVFTKDDSRKCMIFISAASGKQAEANSINVDIKCDR